MDEYHLKTLQFLNHFYRFPDGFVDFTKPIPSNFARKYDEQLDILVENGLIGEWYEYKPNDFDFDLNAIAITHALTDYAENTLWEDTWSILVEIDWDEITWVIGSDDNNCSALRVLNFIGALALSRGFNTFTIESLMNVEDYRGIGTLKIRIDLV